MRTLFNPTKYKGKDRVFVSIKGARGLSRIHYWDEARQRYVPPIYNSYSARKTVFDMGVGKHRIQKVFNSLEEARRWQISNQQNPVVTLNSPTFEIVVQQWKSKTFARNKPTTNDRYESMLKNYFSGLMNLPVSDIVPKVVDEWLVYLKDPANGWVQSSRRKTFEHELELLTTVLKFYEEYDDTNVFRCPIKKRHRKDAVLNKDIQSRPQDLKQEEFFQFREELRKTKYGDVLSDLATFHFYCALRVSEAAAVQWENVKLVKSAPVNSSVSITHSLRYRRKGGIEPELVAGYKNSRANGGSKSFTLHPEVYSVLSKRHHPWAKGLVFLIDDKPITFRCLQHYYNLSFERAGLPYRGTHVLRHGGCRYFYNMTGDLGIAKQVLGNADMKTVQVYAQRDPRALNQLMQEQIWPELRDALVTNGDS